MTLDTWVPFRDEGSVVRCRVFCFPHAAGSAVYYRSLRGLMAPEIDLCPVVLPGRAARLDERPLTSMRALMDELQEVLPQRVEYGDCLGRACESDGHDNGAVVVFAEVALEPRMRRLQVCRRFGPGGFDRAPSHT